MSLSVQSTATCQIYNVPRASLNREPCKMLNDPKQGKIINMKLWTENNSVQQLKNLYTFINPFEVENFLSQHDYLYPVLFEAEDKILEIFGKKAKAINLRYNKDPEGDFDEIVVVVETGLPPDDALDLVDRFDEEWYDNEVDAGTQKLFYVTVKEEEELVKELEIIKQQNQSSRQWDDVLKELKSGV
jgi:hypothetical protein